MQSTVGGVQSPGGGVEGVHSVMRVHVVTGGGVEGLSVVQEVMLSGKSVSSRCEGSFIEATKSLRNWRPRRVESILAFSGDIY